MQSKSKRLTTRQLTTIAILAAISAVLFMVEIPVVLFYKLDFSNLPVLLGAFAMGPGPATLILLIKSLLGLLHTSSQGVGELADFLMGFAMILPAGLIYQRHKTRKGALIGLVVGTVAATIAGVLRGGIWDAGGADRFHGAGPDSCHSGRMGFCAADHRPVQLGQVDSDQRCYAAGLQAPFSPSPPPGLKPWTRFRPLCGRGGCLFGVGGEGRRDTTGAVARLADGASKAELVWLG